MQLFFLRHGQADRSAWSGDDRQRPLTLQGRLRIQKTARQFERLGVSADYILTSPLRRALQTAEIVAATLDQKRNLVQEQRLQPGFDLQQCQALLSDYATCKKLMLVGHEPDFSVVIGQLIGGGSVRCKKGGLARVDLPDPLALHGELIWLLPPRVLIH
jgi:phosphohistidine phosphatase